MYYLVNLPPPTHITKIVWLLCIPERGSFDFSASSDLRPLRFLSFSCPVWLTAHSHILRGSDLIEWKEKGQTWIPIRTLPSGPELSFPHEASKWSGAVSGFVDIYLIFCYSWSYVYSMFSVEVASVSGRQGRYVLKHWLWFCQWVGDLPNWHGFLRA